MTLDPARWVQLDPGSDRRYPLPRWQHDSETLYEGERLRIGVFAADATDPRFRFSGVCDAPLIAFPRTCFLLQPMGGSAVVADPMVALLYEPDRVYYRFAFDDARAKPEGEAEPSSSTSRGPRRDDPPVRARPPASEGDDSAWLELSADRLREEVVGARASSADAANPDDDSSRPGAVWPSLLAPADAATYLLQDQLLRHLEEMRAQRVQPNAELVENASATIVRRTLRDLARLRRTGVRESEGHPAPRPEREEAVAEPFRRQLAGRRLGGMSVRRAIEESGVSKTHVNRVLRAYLGWSPHRYGLELRLRCALLRWAAPPPGAQVACEAAETLADLSRTLGFSSHSHLTARFRQVFGIVPSWLREGSTEGRLRQLLGRF